VLRMPAVLGLDAGDIPGDGDAPFAPSALALVSALRAGYIARINKGIAASGL